MLSREELNDKYNFLKTKYSKETYERKDIQDIYILATMFQATFHFQTYPETELDLEMLIKSNDNELTIHDEIGMTSLVQNIQRFNKYYYEASKDH